MLPSDEEIQSLSAAGDPFKYAVVGFSAIEAALEKLISSFLPVSHRVELRKLSVGLKVDLAISLGLIPLDSKGLLLKLSKIRNFYAHEFKTHTEPCTAAELKGAFSINQRSPVVDHFASASNFTETLRVAFVACFYELKGRINAVEERKVRREETLLHVKAVLEATEPQEPPSERVLREKTKFDKVIEKKKQEILEREGRPNSEE